MPDSSWMVKLSFGAEFLCKYFWEQYTEKPSTSDTLNLVFNLIHYLFKSMLLCPQMLVCEDPEDHPCQKSIRMLGYGSAQLCL